MCLSQGVKWCCSLAAGFSILSHLKMWTFQKSTFWGCNGGSRINPTFFNLFTVVYHPVFYFVFTCTGLKNWKITLIEIESCLSFRYKCDTKGFFTTSTYEFIVIHIALLPWTGCFRHQHKRTYSVWFGNNSSFDAISVFHTLQNEMGLKDVYYWSLKKLMMLTVDRSRLAIYPFPVFIPCFNEPVSTSFHG